MEGVEEVCKKTVPSEAEHLITNQSVGPSSPLGFLERNLNKFGDDEGEPLRGDELYHY